MVDARWLTSTVIDLIAAAIAKRSAEWFPILSDALMDAGCDDEELIVYLRQQDATWFELLDCYRAYWLVKHEGRPLEPDDVLNWMWRFSNSAEGTNETYRIIKQWANQTGGPEELHEEDRELTPMQLVETAARYQCFGENKYMGINSSYWYWENQISEFWRVYETVTGEMVGNRTDSLFQCAC